MSQGRALGDDPKTVTILPTNDTFDRKVATPLYSDFFTEGHVHRAVNSDAGIGKIANDGYIWFRTNRKARRQEDLTNTGIFATLQHYDGLILIVPLHEG